MDDDDGDLEELARDMDLMRLGLALTVANLRLDDEAIDALLGDQDGIAPHVFDLLNGLVLALMHISRDNREFRARVVGGDWYPQLADLMDEWIGDLAGVAPSAKAVAAKEQRKANRRYAKLAAAARTEAAKREALEARYAAHARCPLGTCAMCGMSIPVVDGLIRPHRFALSGPPTDRPRRCPGSDQKPFDLLDPGLHLDYKESEHDDQ